MNENIAIKVENLTKIYPIYNSKNERMKEALSLTRKKYHKDFHALDNINFEIKKGETIGIIGQNGSGKSTLLKILTGVLSPTSGSAQVNGKVSALLELGAGFNPEMTGMENIYLNGTIMGYTKEEMEKRVPKIIAFADIGDFIGQPVKMYSSGMFARLAFAVAINVEPDILIVDEALSVGDMRFQIKCMDHMKKMMDSGTTVLFVSHDISAIRRFCNRAMWVNQGQIKKIGNTNLVCDKYYSFLSTGNDSSEGENEEKHGNREELPKFIKKDCIAEIIGFNINNLYDEPVSTIELEQPIYAEVVYDVYDETIQEPVLGIATLDENDRCICAFNTLLDKVTIPWRYGRNKFRMEFPLGIRINNGQHYFNVALFEKTATIPIQYLTNVKTVKIHSEYLGEGICIVPHEWKD